MQITPTCLGLLQAVYTQPREDTPRLVLADHLDDNGETAWAEFIRAQCELAKPKLMPVFSDAAGYHANLRQREADTYRNLPVHPINAIPNGLPRIHFEIGAFAGSNGRPQALLRRGFPEILRCYWLQWYCIANYAYWHKCGFCNGMGAIEFRPAIGEGRSWNLCRFCQGKQPFRAECLPLEEVWLWGDSLGEYVVDYLADSHGWRFRIDHYDVTVLSHEITREDYDDFYSRHGLSYRTVGPRHDYLVIEKALGKLWPGIAFKILAP